MLYPFFHLATGTTCSNAYTTSALHLPQNSLAETSDSREPAPEWTAIFGDKDMNRLLQKGVFETESDFLALDIVDFGRLNGSWENAGDAMRTIFSFLRDGNASFEVFAVPGFDDAPMRDDFPNWDHVGHHVELAKRFWNWFHIVFPNYELNLSDSPDFQCIERDPSTGCLAHIIWGDFGQVSASAFALCQKLSRADDMWLSVLDNGTRHVLITYRSSGLKTIEDLLNSASSEQAVPNCSSVPSLNNSSSVRGLEDS